VIKSADHVVAAVHASHFNCSLDPRYRASCSCGAGKGNVNLWPTCAAYARMVGRPLSVAEKKAKTGDLVMASWRLICEHTGRHTTQHRLHYDQLADRHVMCTACAAPTSREATR
jgi:hypothetical protein